MLILILQYELKYLSKQLVFIGSAIACFLLGILSLRGSYGGDEVYKNAPYAITTVICLLSLFSLFISTLLTANVVLRDSEYKTEAIIYTTSISKFSYIAGRFLALLAALFFLMGTSALGIYAGTFLISPDELSPNQWRNYLSPLLLFGLPNVLFGVTFLYATALLSRNIKTVYITGVMMYILYLVGSILGNSPLMASSSLKSDHDALLPILLDPFGLTAFYGESRLWSVYQRNHTLFTLEGAFLGNRILWISCSLLVLFVASYLFSFRTSSSSTSGKNPSKIKPIRPIPYRSVVGSTEGARYAWLSFLSQIRVDCIGLFKSPSFAVMLLLWAFLIGIDLKETLFNGLLGISSYPTTGIIIEQLRASRPLLIILIFYAAELVWRERSLRIQALISASPMVDLTFWGAKCATLALLTAVFVSLNITIGITLQLLSGYSNFEPMRYLSLYYYSGLPLFLMGVLTFVIQLVSPNKYIGLLLSILAIGLIIFSRRLGLEHYLLRYASTPELLFSDFNQFGYYAKPFHWYMLYWTAFAGFMFLLSAGWKNKTARKSAFACLAVFILTGSYIFYQSNILQPYWSSDKIRAMKVGYETKYKPFAHLPQPTITAIKIYADLFPEERRYQVKGTYRLENKTALPITKVLVWLDTESNASALALPNAELTEHDAEFGHYWFQLKQPLLPHQQTTMTFSFEVSKQGFARFNNEHSILENGSYIELEKYVPRFGYAEHIEIGDLNERKKQGLPPQIRRSSPANQYALVDFDAVISTAADQRIITVGALQKEWNKHNRHYFHYKTSQPINFMFAISSAKYSILKENYRGVALQLCYLKGHEYNVPGMQKAMKDALKQYSESFGPYQYNRLTLAEIPHYRGSATAYPGVVFCAENINFLSDFRDTAKVNYTYATVAHEISHQWWANQLIPQDDAGYKFLTESLAKYSEVSLLEKSFGKQRMAAYQENDMDLYFSLREGGTAELPLYRSEGQPQVYYQKGGLVMYALKELVGEAAMNQVLKNMLLKHTYPLPKATSADFIHELYAVATSAQRLLIDDWLKKVITYDLKITSATNKKLPNGQYRLTLGIVTRKNEQMPSGQRKAVPVNESFDVAVYDDGPAGEKTPKLLYFQKQAFSGNTTMLTFIISKKPRYAIIDPYCYMPDENRPDNGKIIK
ncbi:ABC transporter permease/M1 family aminopeptidase [Runella sp.]|uniref:ABC transporter permease/M1 family aminopeptidase n=1 Tax=Runella sp. TaxID=1960881 RepID=UPI003D0D3190